MRASTSLHASASKLSHNVSRVKKSHSQRYLLPNGTSRKLDEADAADEHPVAIGVDEAVDDDDSIDEAEDNEDDGVLSRLLCQQSGELSCTICMRPGHLHA